MLPQRGTRPDQRRSARHAYITEIEIGIKRTGDWHILRGCSVDLTLTGMSAFLEPILRPGEVVTIKLPARGNETSITLRATVVNQKDSRCGFRFFPLVPEQADFMKRLIEMALAEQ
jgi:hypothetical protein